MNSNSCSTCHQNPNHITLPNDEISLLVVAHKRLANRINTATYYPKEEMFHALKSIESALSLLMSIEEKV